MKIAKLALLGLAGYLLVRTVGGMPSQSTPLNTNPSPPAVSTTTPTYTQEQIQYQIDQLNRQWKTTRSPVESALRYLEGQMRAGNQNLIPEYRSWQEKGREISRFYQAGIAQWRALL